MNYHYCNEMSVFTDSDVVLLICCGTVRPELSSSSACPVCTCDKCTPCAQRCQSELSHKSSVSFHSLSRTAVNLTVKNDCILGCELLANLILPEIYGNLWKHWLQPGTAMYSIPLNLPCFSCMTEQDHRKTAT